jgi:hypothetical protein
VKQPPEDPVVVTSAGMSGTEDRELRERRYAITQALRMLCFLLAVFLPVPLWLKLVFVAGAFALPWMGVVAANAGPTKERARRQAPGVTPSAPLPTAALEPGRTIDQEL